MATVLISIALGLVLEIFYDVQKAIRTELGHKSLRIFFQDILFFVVSASAVFCLMIMRTNGQPRCYVFLGLAAGFAVARMLVSPWNLCFLRFIVRSFHRIVRKTKKTVSKFERFLAAKISQILKNFVRTVKKGLKQVNVMVYNLFDNKNRKNENNGK